VSGLKSTFTALATGRAVLVRTLLTEPLVLLDLVSDFFVFGSSTFAGAGVSSV